MQKNVTDSTNQICKLEEMLVLVPVQFVNLEMSWYQYWSNFGSFILYCSVLYCTVFLLYHTVLYWIDPRVAIQGQGLHTQGFDALPTVLYCTVLYIKY